MPVYTFKNASKATETFELELSETETCVHGLGCWRLG
jgi:hypothetical protein